MSGDWYNRAACLGVDYTLFFRESKQTLVISRYCLNCPVMMQCRLAGDLEEREYGNSIWGVRGGETAMQRKQRRGYIRAPRKRKRLSEAS